VPPFFPSFVLFAQPPTPEQYEHRHAGVQAHNRWMADYVAQKPEARAGIGQIFLNDLDDAIADVAWCKENDLRGGVLVGSVPPTRNLRFVWQRAEENPVTESGGAMLVREGVCEGVSRVYGLHVDANRTSGWFLSRPGAHMANSDRLQVRIKCQGGHVARPHHGSNAADIAVDVCSALRGFGLRTLGPHEAISLVPAIVRAGTASNVRPDTAELWFAVRNFLDAERREAFEAALVREIEQLVRRYADATVTVTPVRGHPSLINTAAEVEWVRRLLDEAGLETVDDDTRFGGEDFAWYLHARPGCFWFLGAGTEDSADHHAPRFNPDPAAFWRGVHYWLILATAPTEAGARR